MKSEYIRISTTPRRFNKLKLLADQREKSMTQPIEDWIDSLPEPKKENMTQKVNALNRFHPLRKRRMCLPESNNIRA